MLLSRGSDAIALSLHKTRATFPSKIGARTLNASDAIAPAVYRPTPGSACNSCKFAGIIPANSVINDVRVEIYRVFPNDSDTARTPNVVTRTNSPSDVAFADRSSNDGNLSFSTSVLSANFTALNSVLNGINPSPTQTTGGEGSVTGQEVRFSIDFLTPFKLPKDHYFFIPQVELAGSTDNFFWLSSERPIVSGTPFLPDLQSWIRNANLDPDWSRIGADIVGGNPAPTFNGSFSLTGTVPDTGSTAAPFGSGVIALIWLKRRAA